MDIICRYGVPHTIITDNDRQFIDKELAKFYTGLGIKHIKSSVEHPQTNGQAEAANKVILVELRKRLDNAKGRWLEELVEVLWAYRCTPQSATNESPFSLVYGAYNNKRHRSHAIAQILKNKNKKTQRSI